MYSNFIMRSGGAMNVRERRASVGDRPSCEEYDLTGLSNETDFD